MERRPTVKILQVVTLVAQGGAFGGPVSVATAQCEELAQSDRQNSVEMWAGWDSMGEVDAGDARPVLFPTIRMVPGMGFSGLGAPRLWRAMMRRRADFDVIHVHMGRDLISLIAATIAALGSTRLVIQTHGMVEPDRRIRARVLDPAVRFVLRRACAVLVLTAHESAAISSLTRGRANTVIVNNGVRIPPARRFRAGDRLTFLFMARLHPRKRAAVFAHAAVDVHARSRGKTQFVIAGPDEGDLAEVQDILSEHTEVSMRYVGALSAKQAQLAMASADVYVLPSVGEVYPMTVVEALSQGIPTVITNDCGLAQDLKNRNAAIIIDENGGVQALADALLELAADPGRLAELSTAGRAAAEELFNIERIADGLESVYAGSSTRNLASTDT